MNTVPQSRNERDKKNRHLVMALICLVIAPICLFTGLTADFNKGAEAAIVVIPACLAFILCLWLFGANLARAYKVQVEPNEYGEA